MEIENKIRAANAALIAAIKSGDEVAYKLAIAAFNAAISELKKALGIGGLNG